ncbi:MAG: tandem-95 repeat protein [Proteobacteria bacterium]|nr:tandem-95 repeat protein [Pseudomonadota bacterium]
MARRQAQSSASEIETAAEQPYGAVIDAAGDAVTVPYGTMLLDAAFSRQGPDLLLTGDGGESVLVRGYFAAEAPPALLTEGGARLSPDTAEALAGPAAPGQYAQAAPGSAQQPIGTVDAADGEVFASRADGNRVSLEAGDAVFQGDVLETAGDGALNITFSDGTEFSLDENARMVLDELVYDPGTGEGSAAFTVIQGVFTFVSGAIARSGPDAMTVDTPVATIGISGTKVAIRAGAEGEDTVISLLEDEGGQTGEITITNDAGTQILNVANQTVFVESAFIAPPPPTILPSEQIRSLYNDADFDVFAAHPGSSPDSDDRAETLEEQIEAAREQAAEEGAGDAEIDTAEAAAEVAYELALADGLDEGEALDAAEEAFLNALDDGSADGLFQTAAGGEDDFAPLDAGANDGVGSNSAFSFDPITDTGGTLDTGAGTTGGTTGGAGSGGVTPQSSTSTRSSTDGGIGGATTAPDSDDESDAATPTPDSDDTADDATTTPENQDPVAEPGTISGSEDASVLTGSLSASDVDASDTLTFSLAGGGAPALGSVTINADGTYSYVPGAALQSLAQGETQTDRFIYQVDDGSSGTSTASVAITINGANDAPVAMAAVIEGSEDAASLTGSLSASDVDASDTLTFSLASGGAPALGSVTINADGTYSYVPGAALQSLAQGETQTDSFTYQVDDGNGGTATATVTITITGANDGPVAVADQAATEETSSINIDVLANDTDADSGAQLSIASFDATSAYGAEISLNQNGTLNYDPSQSDAIQALLKGETLSDTFAYTVTDEFGATSTTTVAVALSGGDDYIYGTTGNDEIKGTNNSDTIVGLGGRDKIDGRSGDDIIYGDYIGEAPEGVALLNPDNFKDDIHGGRGDDTLYGGLGDDKLDGDSGHDTIYGGEGDDRLIGDKGKDYLYGEAGADRLDGNSGHDQLYGGAGDDRLEGGSGNDILVGGLGADTLKGGRGDDSFRYTSLAEGGDTVTDFRSGKDTFVFDGDDFNGFGEATVETHGRNFSIIGEGGQSINYDADTNTLYYDSGLDGEGYQTIATVEGTVTADDIEIA